MIFCIALTTLLFYSITKSLVSLAFGIAESDGIVSVLANLPDGSGELKKKIAEVFDE